MRHGLSGLSAYRLKRLRKRDGHPAHAPVGVWHLYLYLTHDQVVVISLTSGRVESGRVDIKWLLLGWATVCGQAEHLSI